MNTAVTVTKILTMLAGLAGLLAAAPAQSAADAPPAPPAAASTEAGGGSQATRDGARTAAAATGNSRAVVVGKGDTTYKIIARSMRHLPFKNEIVRAALMQKNPAAFKKGKTEGLVVGAVLQLPTMEDFRRMIPELGKTSGASGADEDEHAEQDADIRKGWVRFP